MEYSPDEINYESYVDDTLKDKKIETISDYLSFIDVETSTDDQIKNALKEELGETETIECKTISKTIDYSKIIYSNEDIEIAKNDNFCGNIDLKHDINEEICSNGIVFADLAEAGEKCCYAEVYSKETGDRNYACLSLSKSQREITKYLQTLLPTKDVDFPTFAKVICKEYHKEYFYNNGNLVEMSQNEICKNKQKPSKEQCTSVEISNSECCYVESSLSFITKKECDEYNSKLSSVNGYDQAILNKFKIDLILNNIPKGKSITDYSPWISELKALIPKTQTINCKSSSKTLDYSSLTITQEDIINAQKDNFCTKLVDNAKEDNCFNGVLLSDFALAGGKCCYLEITIQGQTDKNKKCLPLSKVEMENNILAKELIKEYDSLGQYTAIISCDGFKETYDSSTGKWTIITALSSGSSSSPSQGSSSISSQGSSSSFSSSSSQGSSSSSKSSSSLNNSNSFIKICNFNLSILFLTLLILV